MIESATRTPTVEEAMAELETVARKCWEEYKGEPPSLELIEARVNQFLTSILPPRRPTYVVTLTIPKKVES